MQREYGSAESTHPSRNSAVKRAVRYPCVAVEGFTLAEVVLGGMVLAIAVAAILGAYVGQVTLNEHARNLSLAIQDANRVIEQVRQLNTNCAAPHSPPNLPTVIPTDATGTPQPTSSWNAWMNPGGAGSPKSIGPDPATNNNTNELIVVTCSHRDGPAAGLCQPGNGGQVGSGEWTSGGTTTRDPIRLTVTVCWRHRQRIIGECTAASPTAPLQAADNQGSGPHNQSGVVESPAMLTTLVTCRG